MRKTAFLLASIVAALSSGRALALPPYFDGDDSAFYELPATIPPGAPGTVVRWKRYATSPVLTTNADPVVAYRMLYISSNEAGERTLVSGSVIMPVRLSFYPGNRPIIGFATGTQGMADRCAATYGVQNSTDYDLVYMRPALDEGFALAVTDYQGLGPKTDQFQGNRPDEHTEVVGQINGRNVIDAVRAAPQFANEFDAYRIAHWPEKFAIYANLSKSSRVVFWGYSEGGGAAAWAGELARSYGGSDINYVGTAAGGVPADIAAVGNAINTLGSRQNVAFGVLVAAGIGFKAAYPELTFDSELNAAGISLVSSVKNECLFEFIAKNFAGKTLDQFMNPRPNAPKFSPFTDAQWLTRFEQNRLGKVPPTMPTYLWHGRDDEAVEYCQARKLAKAYCASGVHVVWNPFAGEHVIGWTNGLSPSLEFVKARLKGGTPASSCTTTLANADAYCPGQ